MTQYNRQRLCAKQCSFQYTWASRQEQSYGTYENRKELTNEYVGKTGIIHIYPTHIQVEMDNPYTTQIQWVWIWIRVVGNHWQLEMP